MTELIIYAMASVGFFCAGLLLGLSGIKKWRIRWIELEYDSARIEGRPPRNIDDVFKRSIFE